MSKKAQTVGHAKFELTILHEREIRLAAKALRAWQEDKAGDEQIAMVAVQACMTALYGADKDCPIVIASEGALRMAMQPKETP